MGQRETRGVEAGERRVACLERLSSWPVISYSHACVAYAQGRDTSVTKSLFDWSRKREKGKRKGFFGTTILILHLVPCVCDPNYSAKQKRRERKGRVKSNQLSTPGGSSNVDSSHRFISDHVSRTGERFSLTGVADGARVHPYNHHHPSACGLDGPFEC